MTSWKVLFSVGLVGTVVMFPVMVLVVNPSRPLVIDLLTAGTLLAFMILLFGGIGKLGMENAERRSVKMKPRPRVLTKEERKLPEARRYLRNLVLFVAFIPLSIFLGDVVYGLTNETDGAIVAIVLMISDVVLLAKSERDFDRWVKSLPNA